MDRMQQAAQISVGRAVGFGGFAISLVMLSFAFDFALACKVGFILTLVMTSILLWFHQTAPNRRPEHCEAWLLLSTDDRPSGEQATAIFRKVMAETYLHFAVRTFGISMLMMLLWAFLAMTGAEIGLK